MRLVVKDHHDYLFKHQGKVVATVTKKATVCKISDIELSADGEESKALWLATKAAFGHSLEGLVK